MVSDSLGLSFANRYLAWERRCKTTTKGSTLHQTDQTPAWQSTSKTVLSWVGQYDLLSLNGRLTKKSRCRQ